MIRILSSVFMTGISAFQIVDLTHKIDGNVRAWDGNCGFAVELTGDYSSGGFRGQCYTMRSCLGTHMDLPAHCIEGGSDCSTVDIKNCVVPAYVIDVSEKAHEDYGISVDDIQEFEKCYGKINPESLVLFSTGWSKRWDDPESFRNEKADGVPHFPFITQEAAQFLLTRSVVGIGIDTLSPDPFYLPPHVHKLMLGSGKYIIENIANLENMPAINIFVIALPLKIDGGVESPIRLIGLITNNGYSH